MTLVVRRDRRESTVRITPGTTCLDNVPGAAHTPMPPMPPMPTVAPMTYASPSEAPTPPETPEAPVAPPTPRTLSYGYKYSTDVTPPAPPRAPRAYLPRRPSLPRGWFGVSLNCSECGSELGPEDRAPVWKFGDLPEVYIVEPGSPAARAGLQRGDVLSQINGISLMSPEGGKLFGAVRPGQTVKWTVLRGGSKRDVNVVAATRPEDRAESMSDLMERLRDLREHQQVEQLEPQLHRLEMELDKVRTAMPALAPNPEGRRLRYAGSVGGSDVEVRGLGNVVVDDDGDEIVITTRDATIHIRPQGKSPKPDAKHTLLTALWHFGRGVAQAARGNAADAERERTATPARAGAAAPASAWRCAPPARRGSC